MAHLLLPQHTKPTLRQDQKSHFLQPHVEAYERLEANII